MEPDTGITAMLNKVVALWDGRRPLTPQVHANELAPNLRMTCHKNTFLKSPLGLWEAKLYFTMTATRMPTVAITEPQIHCQWRR